MNKITNINLGGYPFTIDEDAYNELNKYLSTVRNHFSTSEGCDEILDDIEVRMAELFNEKLQGKAIISNKELDDVIKVMGRPEQFESEEATHQTSSNNTSEKRYRKINPGKRLFRDPDEQVIGGVCGGIAAYLGMSDPLWVRIIFIVAAVSGVSILIYPILWAIIPEAKTAGDKLKMRGEATTIDSIAKTIEEELKDLSSKITEISKDIGSKKKINTSVLNPRIAITSFIGLLGSIVMNILGGVKRIFKPLISLVIASLILVLGFMWIGTVIGYVASLPFLSHIGPSNALLAHISGFSLFVLLAIPIVRLMFYCTRWFTDFKIPRKYKLPMNTTWLASLAIVIATGISYLPTFSNKANVTEEVVFPLESETITFQASDSEALLDKGVFQFGDLSFKGKKLVVDNITYNLKKGDGYEIKCIINKHAHGRNMKNATAHANDLNIDLTYNNGVISMPKDALLDKNGKFRGQDITVDIYVPEGVNLKFDPSISYQVRPKDYFTRYRDYQKMSNFEWQITDDGLTSSGWQAEYQAIKRIAFEGISNININGKFDINITKGDKSEFLIKGSKKQLEYIEEVATEETFTLINNTNSKMFTVNIVTPNLESLTTNTTGDIKLMGFSQNEMEINLTNNNSTAVDLDAYVDVNELTINTSAYNQIDLTGTGKTLIINALNAVKVNAQQYKANEVILNGKILYGSTVYASESLQCDEQWLSNIDLFGNGLYASRSEKSTQ